MSVVSNNILAGASGQGGGADVGYQIERSLRFNSGDTATLSKSISSAGNRKTWTFSFWVKLLGGGTYSTNHILCGGLSSIGGSAGQSGFEIEFTDTGALLVNDQVNNSLAWSVKSTALFRDYSAWYHVVVAHDTTQTTASNRLKIYVNGVQLNSFATANYPSQHYESGMNKATTNRLGASDDRGSPYLPSDFYLADVHSIDGQGLDSSSFGEFDANNVWQPKEYSGTYGTNGFHLDFSDNSTTAALGTDTSGNGNSYSLNNFSITAGVGNDSLVDSPTNGYATLNPLHVGHSTLTNGNLDASGSGDLPTIIPGSGQWYYEIGSTGYNWDGTAANFTSAAGSYNFGQRPFSGTPNSGYKALSLANLTSTTVTSSGSYIGNSSTNGPFVFLNGVPTAMSIGGSGVTFGTGIDRLSNGFKIRSSSSNNSNGTSYSFSVTTTGDPFKTARAQTN